MNYHSCSDVCCRISHRWFGDLVSAAGLQDGPYEGLDASDLADHHLVVVVVTREVGQDSGGTRHHVDVIGTQQPDHRLEQAL